MNEILQNIMLFINEHTLLLIGICIFLILVLVGYLIDNSVKSKRIRNDIKNADQVPENIKDEIIKQAEEKTINKEEVKIEEKPNDIVIDNNEVATEELNGPVNLETNNVEPQVQVNNEPQIQPDNQNITDDINSSLDLDSSNSSSDVQPMQTEDLSSSFSLDLEPQTPVNVEAPVDPDAFIMGNVSNNEYSNDKKLSDILSNVNNYSQAQDITSISSLPSEPVNNETIDIFSDPTSNIVVNENVSKNDVQIENNTEVKENTQVENNNGSDELDRIMRKLSSMDNDVKEDNYTNIF